MWNQILLITLLQVLYISTKSIKPIEGPLWLERIRSIGDSVGEAESTLKGRNNILRDYGNIDEDAGIKEKMTLLSSLKSSSEKRALSMFARWGPINTIGKDRNPIRSGYPPKSFDSISTQTRSRMLGQPLRWG
ncbi:uncharacterized protein [Euwallacea fornicatus]|uniref:uncharacterized protein n=1 Tax=Euwallacea fornicatus TaxID=995702 RepID=UPI00338E2EA3